MLPAQDTGIILAIGYWRIDTKVLFGGIVLGLREEVKVLGGRLQQTQLAGARYRFGAPLDL